MPTFPTPDPITASVEIVSGSVHLVATDRDDTVVEVSPRDPDRASDVKVAERCARRIPQWHPHRFGGQAVHLSRSRWCASSSTSQLPSRSRLQVSSHRRRHADGEFGDCRFATASGDQSVDSIAGNIKVDSASGGVAVENLTGSAVISTASGDANVGELRRRRQVPCGQWFAVSQALSRAMSMRKRRRATSPSRGAPTAGSRCRPPAATSKSVSPKALRPSSTCAPHSGEVRNTLQPADGPADGDDTLTVHVRTGSGDIGVQRATAGVPPSPPGRTGTRPICLRAPRTRPESLRAPAPSVWRSRRRRELGPGTRATPVATPPRRARRS